MSSTVRFYIKGLLLSVILFDFVFYVLPEWRIKPFIFNIVYDIPQLCVEPTLLEWGNRETWRIFSLVYQLQQAQWQTLDSTRVLSGATCLRMFYNKRRPTQHQARDSAYSYTFFAAWSVCLFVVCHKSGLQHKFLATPLLKPFDKFRKKCHSWGPSNDTLCM